MFNMVGCGDNISNQKEVCELFHSNYPGQTTELSIVSEIVCKIKEIGHVRRPIPVNESDRQIIMTTVTETPSASVGSYPA